LNSEDLNHIRSVTQALQSGLTRTLQGAQAAGQGAATPAGAANTPPEDGDVIDGEFHEAGK